MSVLETSRKMTSREQTAYDLGFHEGRNAAIVHGRWIYEDDTVMKWTTKAICSACKRKVAHNATLAFEYGIENFEKIHKYCPSCGAKMDGDGNENP